MIAVLDLGQGNLQSVVWAFARLGAEAVRTRARQDIALARAIVLPGVGNFGAAAQSLDALGLRGALRARAQEVPLLGICLGMQLLFERSEEGGEGLGILPGHVQALAAPGLPLPHTGWNAVEPDPAQPFLLGAGAGDAYFVHGYVAAPADPGLVAAWTVYGSPFPAAVARGRIFGVQFHPERSGAYGRRVLQSFLAEVVPCSKSSRPSTSREGTSCA